MRRVLGLVLTGLGAFFLALALLMRFYLPGQVVKFPLSEHLVTTLTGSNASYFSVKQLKVLTGVSVKATSTVEGDAAAGSGSVAVWNDVTAVQDTTNNAPIETVTQRTAFDRRTGAIVNCCADHVSVSYEPTVKGHQSGLGYVWPLGTQKRTYQVYDTTVAKPEPFRYEGTATIHGMTTYKFVEQLTNEQFSKQTLPGSLVGYPSVPSLTLPEYVTETNTFWVDPVTGAPISVTQDHTLSLENSSGVTKLMLFKADMMETPQSVTNAVNTASSAHQKIDLLEDIGPLIGLLLGVALLIIGMTLIIRRRKTEEFAYESDEPVGSTT